MERLDLRNIQGGILYAYGERYLWAAFVFLHFPRSPSPFPSAKIGPGQEWLRAIIGHVTTARATRPGPGRGGPETPLNVMFTARGLQALGLPPASLRSFPADFRQGMAGRAAILGDTGADAPQQWSGVFRPDAPHPVHAVVSIYARTSAGGTERLRWLQAVAAAARILIVCVQPAHQLTTGREHFGFVDGCSQPTLAVEGLGGEPGGGTPVGERDWRPLRVGEFLLGHRDELDARPPSPAPRELGHDGTYVVYRKLRQHVGTFRGFLRSRAGDDAASRDLFAAKLVGRFPDGRPLARLRPRSEPARPPMPARGAEVDPRCVDNDFRFGDDPHGYDCPLGAHIRRANPRDAPLIHGTDVRRHRIIRRGIPYGEPLDPAAEVDDGQDRGLIFVCMQASISRQFEFIQGQWLNDGDVFGLGEEKDALSGNNDGSGKMTFQGEPPRFVSHVPRMVTVRGGDYFFMPSIAGLHYLIDA